MIRTFEAGMYLRERPVENARHILLFIHGLGESGLCFEHLASREELDDCDLLIPDLPGYGRSPWTDGDALSLNAHADTLAQWLRDRGTGPVTLVGHSMGGVLACIFAEKHPDLTAAVIDVDGNKSPGDCVFSCQAIEYTLREFVASGFDTIRDKIYHVGIHDPAQRGYYASLCLADPRSFHLNSAELVSMSEARKMTDRLAALPMPKVYIAGVARGASPETHVLLKVAKVDVKNIEPSGHWPFIDQPDLFLREIRAFLDCG